VDAITVRCSVGQAFRVCVGLPVDVVARRGPPTRAPRSLGCVGDEDACFFTSHLLDDEGTVAFNTQVPLAPWSAASRAPSRSAVYLAVLLVSLLLGM